MKERERPKRWRKEGSQKDEGKGEAKKMNEEQDHFIVLLQDHFIVLLQKQKEREEKKQKEKREAKKINEGKDRPKTEEKEWGQKD